LNGDAFVREGIRQYIRSIYGEIPRSLNPGRDPLRFWDASAFVRSEGIWNTRKNIDTTILRALLRKEQQIPGKNTFSYVPDKGTFRKIAQDIGIGKGSRVIHPYAVDSRYKELLESVGARVDAVDLSLWSVLRADGRLGDAERLVDYVKRPYDHYFAFEPASLFMGSAGPIRGILALASSLNTAEKAHILYMKEPPLQSGPHVDFEAFFSWLKRRFGVDYTLREYPIKGLRTLGIATLEGPERSRRDPLRFARLAHGAILRGLPPAYHRMIRMGERITDINAITYDAPEELLEHHVQGAIKRLKSIRWGQTNALRMLMELGRMRQEVSRSYRRGGSLHFK